MLALFLYTFDPNMIAHGHYVTSDLLVACLMFVAVAVWVEFLSSRRNLHLAGAGLALGLAAATKFSGLILIPTFLTLYVIRWKREREAGFSWRGLVNAMSVVLGLGFVVIAVCYGPETMKIAHGGGCSYLLGLETVIQHDRDGHPAYLLGQIRKQGWWYYFPVAFAVKTPTAVLLLLLLSVVTWAGQSRSQPLFGRPDPQESASTVRIARSDWYVLTVPMAAYFLLSMRSHINIGLRHILPVYPFLFVFVAAAFFNAPWPKFRKVLPLLLNVVILIEVAESAAIYPHYLAFFNVPSGGPSHGARYLLDSNLDWGQDLKNLRRWLDENGNPPVCVQYFGMAYPKLYGLPQNSLPATWETEKRARLDCIGAISVTLLHDVYLKPGEYAWLRELKPIGNVGHSIALFDLRKPGLR
jgi:4-amino-4-deoxy-L-arabinose transferase-like glycosyltransferase